MKSRKVRTEKISLALRMAKCLGVFMVMAALGLSTAKASAVSPFFDSGYECLNNAIPSNPLFCANDPAVTWNTGDFFGENFTGTGLPSIVQLSLHTLIDNDLHLGQTETFDVSINGIVVGSISALPPPGATPPMSGQDPTPQMLTQVFSFLPISGPDYDVRFTVTSPTLGVGAGSVGFVHDGISSSVTLSQVPEPGTMLLLGVGLLGLVIRRTRKA